MAKVGIMSMQRIKNYGSFLQSYGLRKILEELNNNVEFVDYHMEKCIIENENEPANLFVRKIKKGLETLNYDASLKNKMGYIKHKENFEKKYLNMLGLTKEYNYNPKLDCLVIGSDEVFNCIQTNANVGYSMELFGKNNNAKKVITYAASFGNTTLEKIQKYNKEFEIGDLLKKIDCISVRDNNSKDIVNQLTGKEPIVLLDPVLTYDFMNKCNKIPKLNCKEEYMIVYAYNGRINNNESNQIRKFAKEQKLKVYSIGGAQRCADKFIDCNPFEVLSYFNNAKYIVTDTFHGSIFSIINNKKFITLIRKSVGNAYGNEEKLSDLLSRLKLEDRITYNLDNLCEKINKEIDYNTTNKILLKNREDAYEYLMKNI